MDMQKILEQVMQSSAVDDIAKKTGLNADQIGDVVQKGVPDLLNGKSEEKVASKVSKSSGIDPGTVMQVIAMLAPIVMMFLSQKKGGKGGIDIGSMADAMSGKKGSGKSSGNPWMDMANTMFDTNKNGTFIDDLMGRFFGKK